LHYVTPGDSASNQSNHLALAQLQGRTLTDCIPLVLS
jgi:hypothetical protein